METAFARYDVEGKVPGRTGDSHPSLAPFETFAAKDARFVIAAGNDTLFMLMADAIGAPQLALDERFLTNDSRVLNRPALCEAIESITKTHPVGHWIGLLDAAGVPCSPINTIDRLFAHQQLLARNMIIKVKGENTREVRTAGNPIKMPAFRDVDPDVPIRAPALNEHRERILNELMTAERAYAAPAEQPQAQEDKEEVERIERLVA